MFNYILRKYIVLNALYYVYIYYFYVAYAAVKSTTESVLFCVFI